MVIKKIMRQTPSSRARGAKRKRSKPALNGIRLAKQFLLPERGSSFATSFDVILPSSLSTARTLACVGSHVQ
jgi:hypothetical protein